MVANSAGRRWMVSRQSLPLASAAGGLRRLCVIIITATLLSSMHPVTSSGRSVGYDHRAILLDGQRRFLISGSIHYPRSTPQMWPGLLALAKEGGLDVIDTYVFWNGHEPVKGQYNFRDRYDLLGFLREVQKAELFMTLRIGPYICGEWNFGGFPNWLLEIPGVEFRTDNEPFKAEMERFVRFLVTTLKENKMFYTQGGPIILAQIENEYRHVAKWYGEAGKRYTDWAANMAISLNTTVPWIMCSQTEAPEDIIITCNGFYCDDFPSPDYNKPKLWTELYPGWSQYWGQPLVHRPLEDTAFAAARFFQREGSLLNYYMYHGGTNFGRTAGAGIKTSYDFGAPIDEYGQVRQPEWSHLAQLHAAIRLCAPALAAVNDEPSQWIPGRYLEIHVYNSTVISKKANGVRSSSSLCAAFLANRDSVNDAIIEFQGDFYHVPAWSVSILPDCKQVVFNTATVTAQKSTKKWVPLFLGKKSKKRRSTHEGHNNASRRGKPAVSQHQTNCEILEKDTDGGTGERLQWEWFHERVGVSDGGESIITANRPLEQFNVTRDSTDYLWYSSRVSLSNNQISHASLLRLNIRNARIEGPLHVFINGDRVSADSLLDSGGNYSQLGFNPLPGINTIDVLSVTLGHPFSGPWIEAKAGGISGSVSMEGLPGGVLDLTHSAWEHRVGLMGEHLHLEFQDQTANHENPLWSSGKPPVNEALVWYKTTIDLTGTDDGPVALDLGSMRKGLAWMNGHQLGRYWPSQMNPSTVGCSAGCDYRGKYRGTSAKKCHFDCGKPSQRWYHVPREWMKPYGNRLVLFEEVGGDPHGVSISLSRA